MGRLQQGVAWWAIVLALASGEQAWAQGALPAPETAPAPADTYQQNLCYALGRNIGTDMRQNGIEIDVNALVAGLTDALKGAPSRLPEEELQAVMLRFQQEMQKKAEAQMADAGAKNQTEGQAFLAENAKKEGVQTTPSGLQYKVLKSGPAGGQSPTRQSTVEAHYEGRLIDGSVFDSSYQRGEPLVIPAGRVIKGWTEALTMMKPGDQWEVYIPSELGYGPEGSPPVIPPHATLIFKMELLGVR